MPRRFQLFTRCCQPGLESMPNRRPNAASPPTDEIKAEVSDGVISDAHSKRGVYRLSNSPFTAARSGPHRVGAVTDVLYTKKVLDMAAERGMNQQAFREAMNVSTGVMTNWKGRKTIPPTQHAKVAEVLKCSLDELLGRAKPSIPAGWPFSRIHPTRFYNLSEGERMRLEGFLVDELVKIEAERRQKPQKPARRAASG